MYTLEVYIHPVHGIFEYRHSFYTVMEGFIVFDWSDPLVFVLVGIMFYISLFVITASNLVYSIISLVIVFLSSTFFTMYVWADFIAFLVIIIYVGAIAVLFLFVIMIVNFYVTETAFVLRETFIVLWSFTFVFLVIMYSYPVLIGYLDVDGAGCLVTETNYFFSYNFIMDDDGFYKLTLLDFKLMNFTVLHDLGLFLYSYCGVVLIWAGVVLYVGTLGVLYMLQFFYESDRQRQDMSEQLVRMARIDLIRYKLA